MEKTIFVGITNDDELYRLNIEIEERNGIKNYFSMTGETVGLESEENLKQYAQDSLEGEFWQQAVADGQTELGKYDWVDYVLDTDGWESMSDIDYTLSPVEIDGEDYYFTWQSAGQHEVNEFKKLFISEELRKELMDLWKKYHLEEFNGALPELPEQNIEDIAKQSAEFILEQ